MRSQYGYSGMALEMDTAFLGIMRQIAAKDRALHESPAPAP